MTDTVKVVLIDIEWPEGFIGPKKTWARPPRHLVGWNDSSRLMVFLRGYLQGVYGEIPTNFTVLAEVVSNG